MGKCEKNSQQTNILEDDVNGEGDETKLFESTMKLFNKALTSFKLHDPKKFVLSMEHVVANWILDFSVATYVIGNLKLFHEIKPQIRFFSIIKSTKNVYHNVEVQGHAKVQFENDEITNNKDVFYVLSVNKKSFVCWRNH
jgi:hypothetical protein